MPSWKLISQLMTHIATMAGIAILMVALLLLTDFLTGERRERTREENNSYTQQLQALNNVQGSLNNLIQFVELQKTRLKESEDLVNTLKSEQEKLKPVVEADRKTVDAILELQNQKAQGGVWRERGIGFVLGILSSVLASVIVSFIASKFRRTKNPPSTPATA